ncbi:MAG TPA: ADOP family duplicated permease [Gemmatimonadaceae bacterium]|nr:ADOP family duplicated permease [Gemmatimonadaceae bacterium]
MGSMRNYRRLFDLRLGGRSRSAAEMDLEIESHLAMRVADLVAAGVSPADARAEALRRFGDLDLARAKLHAAARERESAMRRRDRIGALVSDLRYAARQARRAPAFTTIVVGALAIGIGATTAMFTLIDHVLLRPLPFPQADRLVTIGGRDSSGNSVPEVSSADWLDWRAAPDLEASAIYSFGFRQGIVAADSAVVVDAERVSSTFFEVLRPRFVAGRPFTEREALSGEPVVVISERLWREMFGADPRLAAPLRTARRAYTVVGVVAAGEDYPAGNDVWFASALTPATDPVRTNINWYEIGRLRPGATRAHAASELATIARGVRAADPAALYDFGADVESLDGSIVGYASTTLGLLFGIAGLVLLIVCANVAAAGLARGAARGREIAVRKSLGASRGRIMQQLLVEHLSLGLMGGILGLGLAWTAVHALLARWGGQIPRASEVSLDARVFAFALAASLVAGVLAGLLPSLRISSVSFRALLSSGGRTSARGGRRLAGSTLVIAEMAMTLVLLIGAALLVRSLRVLLRRDIGFDTNVATAQITLGGPQYATDTSRRYVYWNQILDSYRAIPGVQGAAVTNWIPLGLTGQGFVDIAERDVPGAGAVYRTVSEEFFRTLSIPLITGRVFDRVQDGATSPRVVLINRRMAEMYWPNENPIGKRVRARSMEHGANGRPADWLTIIGVVGDVRTYGPATPPRPEMYALFRQTPSWTTNMTVVVRGSGRASSLFHELRVRARAIDPSVAVDLGTIDQRYRDTLAVRTLTLSMLGGFAALALILAALGIYGVLSYAVARRARELAVRTALGAQRAQLLVMVLAEGLRVVAIGTAFGLLGAFWSSSLLRSMLVDVTTTDPAAYVAAIAVLVVASMAAIIVPARRATQLDPMIALQAE